MMDVMHKPPAPSRPLAWPSECVLTAQALTPEAMQPYGWMLDVDQAFANHSARAINAGTSRRADVPGPLTLTGEGGRGMACVFRAQGQPGRGPWRVLERHRLGSQTFVPMAAPHKALTERGQAIGLLLLALGDSQPEWASLRAFWFSAQQAFTLKPGTWHHPLIALMDFDFCVIERVAAEVDCELCDLPSPVLIEV